MKRPILKLRHANYDYISCLAISRLLSMELLLTHQWFIVASFRYAFIQRVLSVKTSCAQTIRVFSEAERRTW